jgi:hypothetical protein
MRWECVVEGIKLHHLIDERNTAEVLGTQLV